LSRSSSDATSPSCRDSASPAASVTEGRLSHRASGAPG
jgi:hypothetical protein